MLVTSAWQDTAALAGSAAHLGPEINAQAECRACCYAPGLGLAARRRRAFMPDDAGCSSERHEGAHRRPQQGSQFRRSGAFCRPGLFITSLAAGSLAQTAAASFAATSSVEPQQASPRPPAVAGFQQPSPSRFSSRLGCRWQPQFFAAGFRRRFRAAPGKKAWRRLMAAGLLCKRPLRFALATGLSLSPQTAGSFAARLDAGLGGFLDPGGQRIDLAVHSSTSSRLQLSARDADNAIPGACQLPRLAPRMTRGPEHNRPLALWAGGSLRHTTCTRHRTSALFQLLAVFHQRYSRTDFTRLADLR